MLKHRADVLDFLLNRRSRPGKTLRTPAPSRDQLEPILSAGLRVPDHGKLEPWRLIVLEKSACERLAGAVEVCGADVDPEKVEKEVRLWQNAPLIIVVVSAPFEGIKIPVSEQILSSGAVCLSLVNAALASGWGANWLTNFPAFSTTFKSELGLEPGEEIAGFIHIGTEGAVPPERPRPSLAEKVHWVET